MHYDTGCVICAILGGLPLMVFRHGGTLSAKIFVDFVLRLWRIASAGHWGTFDSAWNAKGYYSLSRMIFNEDTKFEIEVRILKFREREVGMYELRKEEPEKSEQKTEEPEYNFIGKYNELFRTAGAEDIPKPKCVDLDFLEKPKEMLSFGGLDLKSIEPCVIIVKPFLQFPMAFVSTGLRLFKPERILVVASTGPGVDALYRPNEYNDHPIIAEITRFVSPFSFSFALRRFLPLSFFSVRSPRVLRAGKTGSRWIAIALRGSILPGVHEQSPH